MVSVERVPLGISYDWLPIGSEGVPEQETFAEVMIFVNGRCATRVEDLLAKSVRTSVRLSTYCLAEWFATNWWRLLWEPKSPSYEWKESHKVGNVGSGYVWPNLEFSSDWNTMLVSCQSTEGNPSEPIRYLNSYNEFILLDDFEKSVEQFIGGTLARLGNVNVRRPDLADLWDEVLRERKDPQLAAERKLEACMGYDPDEAPEGLLQSLLRESESFGADAFQEIAAVCKQDTLLAIKEASEASQQTPIDAVIPQYDLIRKQVSEGRSVIPWERGEKAAEIARATWGMEVPVQQKSLLQLFSLSEEQFSESAPNFQSINLGFRSETASDQFSVSWNGNHRNSRRFSLMRLVADHITASDRDRVLPGTRAFTSRQKFQRAFAQAFLCPEDALRDYLGNVTPQEEEINNAASYFDVSPLTVCNVLVNKGLAEREAIEALGIWNTYDYRG